MLYIDFLKTLDHCPFCADPAQGVVKENEHAVLKCALAPYAPYHLLAIPKRHLEDFLDLTRDERAAIDDLIADAARMFESMGLADYSVMVRNGDKKKVGKSIDHVHFHVVPEARLGTIDANGDDRAILSPEDMSRITDMIRKKI
ncbi:MAG: HIT family protein [Candidatus Paceibacterota bacterium]|jgi:histidine triad (HIT) family protein